jgi:thiol-disulfide isomerase/thioredoxin
MTTGKVVLITILAGTLSVGLALLGQRWLGEGRPMEIRLPSLKQTADDRLQSLPEFRLRNLQGREIASSAWAGKLLVLNFWASWCPPCVREMPILAEAHDTHRDLQVVGIAIDNREDVIRFLAEHPVNYPVLIGDTVAIEMSRRLGNRLQGLPFTVIFDPQGNKIHSQIGEITRSSLEAHLAGLLPASGPARKAEN